LNSKFKIQIGFERKLYYMAFPKANPIRHFHTSVTKSHPLSDTEAFGCRIVAAPTSVASSWRPQPHWPFAPAALFAMLSPHRAGGRPANCSGDGNDLPLLCGPAHASFFPDGRVELSKKLDIFPKDGIIFSLVLQLFHGI